VSEGSQPPVPFIGLTGGMGAGKSTALAALGRLGCATTSADEIVHRLYGESSSLRDALIDRWGDDVAPEGVIDRQAVARHAFSSDEERRWLEALIWPLVGERIWRFRKDADAAEPRPRAAVVETPLLFEAGMEDIYDATIAIVASDAERRARAEGRGHAATDEREARQLSQAEKAARATYAVTNDGSVAELEAQLASVLTAIAGS
jgi:dephospho-CoA kinase